MKSPKWENSIGTLVIEILSNRKKPNLFYRIIRNESFCWMEWTPSMCTSRAVSSVCFCVCVCVYAFKLTEAAPGGSLNLLHTHTNTGPNRLGHDLF